MYKLFSVVIIVLIATGCARTPVKPVLAQPKTIQHQDREIVFSGSYMVKENDLTISVNGDPIMKGRFPPFTPTTNIKATHEGVNFGAYCYFGSVLSKKRSLAGMIAGAVQSSVGKSGDTCEAKIDGEIVEKLYF